MKKVILFWLAIGLASFSMAQESELEAKQKELSSLEADLKEKQAKIAGLKAEIKGLKPPVYWKKGAFTALNFNSLGLTNWAAGGVEANSVTAIGNVFANYSKGKLHWINNLDLAYGLIQNKGEDLRKNEDKIDYLTKLTYRPSKRLGYAVLVNYKSQFAPGYDFNDSDPERPVISRFMAPAYIQTSIGIDYKVNKVLSLYFSPAAGKFTVVNDDSIADMNIYIPALLDDNGRQFYNNNFRAEFGIFLNALYNQDFGENLNVRSRLDLFNNWTDKNAANRENVDVNWETMVNMKLTKYIGISLFGHLIYDNDVAVPTEFDVDGNPIAFGPRTQFKRVFGLGFSYKF